MLRWHRGNMTMPHCVKCETWHRVAVDMDTQVSQPVHTWPALNIRLSHTESLSPVRLPNAWRYSVGSNTHRTYSLKDFQNTEKWHDHGHVLKTCVMNFECTRAKKDNPHFITACPNLPCSITIM